MAHEDHAVRACYAALAMQEAIGRYSEEMRRTHGLAVQFRVGLNSGEVVVRAIGNDLHMDYSAIGQTAGSGREETKGTGHEDDKTGVLRHVGRRHGRAVGHFGGEA